VAHRANRHFDVHGLTPFGSGGPTPVDSQAQKKGKKPAEPSGEILDWPAADKIARE
jgi:hypothetical protein